MGAAAVAAGTRMALLAPMSLAPVVAATPLALMGYAYVGYPALLRLLTMRRRSTLPPEPAEWPSITVTVPVYNEERHIAAALDRLLDTDYPADRRQILVISDASSDRTDDIVRSYSDRGVELLRLPSRQGKTSAENFAGRAARGSIIINADASVRVQRDALKLLVRAFGDPTVGVASGRDVSVGSEAESNGGESGYVGYEMWVRSLETKLGSIIGASGCFYGFRRECHDTNFPEHLSRDFASVLIARERGYRGVSVDEAVCVVPRTASIGRELQRKVRTMARGLDTLWYKRHLMNPGRYGTFSFMLLSHKLARWLVYPALIPAAAGLVWWATESSLGASILSLTALGTILGIAGMKWPKRGKVPRVLAIPGFILAANLAGVLAWVKSLRGQSIPVWEPTRRTA